MDGQMDKSNAYCPLPYCREHNKKVHLRGACFKSQYCAYQRCTRRLFTFRLAAKVPHGMLCSSGDIRFEKIQDDHLSGKPGNVREFDSCQGNVRDFTENQGIVREKILSGKSCLKLFIVN